MSFELHWRENDKGDLAPVLLGPDGKPLNGQDVVWAPQRGSQEAFLTCPLFEVLYEGTRGPGKTDCLLMDFAQHCGIGYGREWRGVLFRQTFPQLVDVINKSLKWFPLIFPQAKYNQSSHTWTWPDGEQLLLRQMAKPVDYWNYHGHAYPWIGWEELCNWPTDECYKLMMSCSRSTVRDMPRKYRATTNPYGPGHNWVKARFKLPHRRGQIIRDARAADGKPEPPRVAIHGNIYENRILLHAEPDYIDKIRAAARNPSELAAWLHGSWDIVAGGMFDDVWRPAVHVVPSIPLRDIPRGWKIDRSFDWGSSKPFSVGWWAESNGEPMTIRGRQYGTVRGDLFRIAEWYGWTGKRNEGVKMLAGDIATGILDREDDWGIRGRVRPGPADSAIFDEENGNNIARDMEKKGVKWEPADKGPGSRKQGWEQIRKAMSNAMPNKDGSPRENPGLWVFDSCDQFLETIPSLTRDDKDLDDVDTDAEDHIADETRYRVRRKIRSSGSRNM